MYYRPKTFLLFLVLSTITHHFNCIMEEARGKSLFKVIYNVTDQTKPSRLKSARPRVVLSEEHLNQTLEYESTLLTSFNNKAYHMEDGFQADAPSLEITGSSGSVHRSQPGSFKPKVRCSGDVMTLTAHGIEYTHILVDRAGASPLYLFQLPSHCGYNVRVTWRDLVLMAPFDGCYITQENGRYVLSLLWWGRPIKITCPMKQTSQVTPSVFCSYFGMIIGIQGAQEPVEKHKVKVNGELLPLLSDTCAYRANSPPGVVTLHTAFSSECVTLMAGEKRLVIIVDGKQFILSCPFPHFSPFLPYLHSHPFPQPVHPKPLVPNVPASIRVTGTLRQPSTTTKPPAVPPVPYKPPQFYPDRVQQPHSSVQVDTAGFSAQQYPPVHHIEQIPAVQTGQGPTEEQQYHLMTNPLHHIPYPILCPPFPEEFCSQNPQYLQTLTAASKPTSQQISTYMPPTPHDMQTALLPQLPIFPLLPTEQPSKVPSLSCTRNGITATLPFAKIDSIKVKDTKTNAWMSVASVPASCNYNLRSRGDTVVLSSPLPACHTKKLSSSVISLFIRFWDSSLLRSRTIQLQCRHAVPPLPPIVPQTPAKTTPAGQPPKVQVLCSSQHMSVTVPPGPTSGLTVEAPTGGIKTQPEPVPVLEAPSHCGYSVKSVKGGALNILLPYSSCHMTHQNGEHKIILRYQTPPDGHTVETLLSCQASDGHECRVVPDQRLVCGSGILSSTECRDKGCCYCSETHVCYYPMDECTADRHFVFSVHSSVVDPPLSPHTLVTAGNSSCTPQKVNADFALFKIPLDKCGVHRYEVGKAVIYMVEVLNRVHSVSLSYGTITRDSPVRLLVECRYYPGSVVSVGYLVKSPSLGPSIKAQGVFGVQLRIAEDEHYSDFYPQYHQPLRMLLGKPLYLEVRLLNPPDPTAMLLVHYCVAYPRSAKSTWILIYDGCPNSLDQTPTHEPPATPAEALTNHVRRFTVSTFQFLPDDDNVQTEEEIYFMCSTEVCLPADGPCIEGCFGDPVNVKS